MKQVPLEKDVSLVIVVNTAVTLLYVVEPVSTRVLDFFWWGIMHSLTIDLASKCTRSL